MSTHTPHSCESPWRILTSAIWVALLSSSRQARLGARMAYHHAIGSVGTGKSLTCRWASALTLCGRADMPGHVAAENHD